MEDDEVLASVQALYALSSVILGKLEATQVAQDALVGTLVKTFPPMHPVLENNLRVLAAAREDAIQPAALESFRNHVADIHKRLAALK